VHELFPQERGTWKGSVSGNNNGASGYPYCFDKIYANEDLHYNLAKNVETEAKKFSPSTDTERRKTETILNDRSGENKTHRIDVKEEDKNICQAEVFDLFMVDPMYSIT
jgi:hypothetical protein